MNTLLLNDLLTLTVSVNLHTIYQQWLVNSHLYSVPLYSFILIPHSTRWTMEAESNNTCGHELQNQLLLYQQWVYEQRLSLQLHDIIIRKQCCCIQELVSTVEQSKSSQTCVEQQSKVQKEIITTLCQMLPNQLCENEQLVDVAAIIQKNELL